MHSILNFHYWISVSRSPIDVARHALCLCIDAACHSAFTSTPVTGLTPSQSASGRLSASPSSLPSAAPVYASNEEEASTSSSTATATQEKGAYDEDVEVSDAQALEYVSQIKRVLELLKKNRDMVFGEVKLTIMIEDPRDVERKRLLGIDDENAPTREDLAAALEEVSILLFFC
nr:ycf3-interacting protein 1, chloroplastic [Ipomoea batatas]